jgi:hypothetical protein
MCCSDDVAGRKTGVEGCKDGKGDVHVRFLCLDGSATRTECSGVEKTACSMRREELQPIILVLSQLT